MRLNINKVVVGIAALAVALAIGAPANAQNKCAAGKLKCVAKKQACKLGCHAKDEGKNDPVALAACLTKCEDKFDGGAVPSKGCFAKLETKPPCLTVGDTATQEAKVDAFVLDVVQELDPGYPPSTINKCSAAKKKCVLKKASAKLGCESKNAAKPDGAALTACNTKAEDKFDGGAVPSKGCFAKLETKPPCLTLGDTAALEAKVDAFVADIAGDLNPGGGGEVCGDGAITGTEDCDTVGAGNSCQNAANTSAAFICNATTCKCACPTKVTFAGNATDPASVLDTGWTGISHRAPIISNGEVTVTLTCPGGGTSRPCGTCTVSGPVANPNAGAGQLDSRRCTNDTSIRCTSNAPCTGGGGTCQFFFGSNLPLAAGGVTTCVVNQFNGSVTGTANVETGEAVNSANLTARVYNGIAIDSPCARCNNDATINDGVLGGTCTGGTRNGLTCDANGTVPGRPDFGKTSLDCPLASGALIATLPIDLTNATDPVVRTVTAANPPCSGEPGERCLCDTCNNINQEPCDNNGDCPDPAGPIGPTCGGKRCIGGTNAGAACTANSECPMGGICNKPGEPTKPSACLDDTNTPGVLDCSDTSPVDGEGECTEGPVTQSCSVASGHAQRGCTVAADCGGGVGSCESNNRQCFLTGGFSGKNGTNTLIAVGMEDPPMNDVSNPTLGAVFCVGPTGLAAVNNVAGLPGPGRVTIKGTAVGLP